MPWRVPNLWQGGECWIIGGGASVPYLFGVPEKVIKQVTGHLRAASAYSPYLAALHDKHVIGVNNTYRLGHWLDIVFFGDCSWYLVHRKELAKFPNLKVTCCPRWASKPKQVAEGVKFVVKDNERRQGISKSPFKVSWNGNSGGAAISLAASTGVKRIYLLGFDMTMGEGNVSHWHGSHHPEKTKSQIKKPPFGRHLKGFPTIAKDAKKLGIEIINVSPNSVIDVFPKKTLEQVL